jgi:ABC-2 type transport system permease protein
VNATVAQLTARSLLGRRRALLLLALPGVLVLLAGAIRGLAGRDDMVTVHVLGGFALATLVPLVGLIAGTGAIGPEIDDGSIVYLLSKPIKRSTIVLTKALVAIGCIFVLGALPIVLAGLILDPAGFKIAVAFGIGSLLAGVAYTAIFIALSVMTGNEVTIGLLYALLWESVMGQYVDGAKMLSVQQWALAVVSKVADGNGIESAVKLPISLILLVLVTVIGLALAVSRLRSLTLSSAE